ncbi:MAG: serine/threonine-protein kinase [Thermoanaerobaculia bacterium]
MPLEAGSRLGSYEVGQALGSGAMGEVYRARDSQLDREVAIKILPGDLAEDQERLVRFEREARVLASLNHPNIATLYGFEREGDTRFLVMELVEGDDLAVRLQRAPLPLSEALPLLLQMAEGLEAAHEKGVIHRDLKPANVKVTQEGRVKILDFGLAKAAGDDGTVRDPGESSTLSIGATRAGAVMGSLAYMSPEQARGQRVDKRADIWAFGAIMYEMLSGRRPFAGKTASDTMVAVLSGDPSWDALPSDLPSRALALLRRCLRKEARERLRDIGDARLELTEILAARQAEGEAATGIDAAGSDASASSIETPMGGESRPRAGPTGVVVGAIASLLAVALALWVFRAPPAEPVVYLMDTAAPLGVYDPQTREKGETNADDLTDVLGDLPVRLVKENVSPHWRRENQVLLQHPALVVIHYSSFAHQPDVESRDSEDEDDLATRRLVELYEHGWSKCVAFLGYVGLGSPRTEFLVYSRGFSDDTLREQFLNEAVTRFPHLEGRITIMGVPRRDGQASFRDPATAELFHSRVVEILGLE